MKFRISDEIFEKYPELNIGVVIARGINNSGKNSEVIELINEQQEKIRKEIGISKLSEIPKIRAWRQAYSSFGAKPKKYKCSVENLYRMILQDIDLKHINKLVDIYNYISIKNIVPMGGDDLDKVEGNILLTFAKGDEKFKQLNSDEIKNPRAGEVIYMDDREVLCRRWNWRESDKSKMIEETRNVAIVVEGLPPVTEEEINEILSELDSLVTKYCGGETQKIILNKNKKESEI